MRVVDSVTFNPNFGKQSVSLPEIRKLISVKKRKQGAQGFRVEKVTFFFEVETSSESKNLTLYSVPEGNSIKFSTKARPIGSEIFNESAFHYYMLDLYENDAGVV